MDKKEYEFSPVIVSYLETDWEKWRREHIMVLEVDGLPVDEIKLTDSAEDRNLKRLIADVKVINKRTEKIYKDGIKAQNKFRTKGI